MDQVQEVLREHIKAGEWGKFLPSERSLAERMNVGRTTLRQALAGLEKEGLIEHSRQGQRRKILARAPVSPPQRVRRVVLLSPYEPRRLSSFILREVDILRKLFNESQIRLDALSSKAFNVQRCSRILWRLTHLESADLWILQMAPRPMQSWFDQHREFPAMIIGYTFDGISLPHVTEDIVAAARHSVGQLALQGHRSIALLTPASPLAGDIRVREAIEQDCRRVDIHVQRVVYKDAPRDLCASLDHALGTPQPPTALLTTMTSNVATCMTHLARRGLKVPDDISIISLLDDPSLDNLVPEVTRYTVNEDSFMRQVFVMADKIMTGRKASYDPGRQIPEIARGGTLGRGPGT